jgi:outer membrane protein
VVIKAGFASAVVATIVASWSVAARADDFDPWEVRLRALRIDTRGGSDAVTGLLPADTVVVQSKTIPEIDFTYFFTRNISAELVLTYPQKMDVAINAGGIGHIGTVDVLPPDLMAQYHFMPEQAFDPYLGAGINVTWLTKVDLEVPGLGLDTNKVSVDPVLQAGFDYKIDRNWVVNLDAKYEWMSFSLRSNGTNISTLHVDPWLFGLGVGYKF